MRELCRRSDGLEYEKYTVNPIPAHRLTALEKKGPSYGEAMAAFGLGALFLVASQCTEEELSRLPVSHRRK